MSMELDLSVQKTSYKKEVISECILTAFSCSVCVLPMHVLLWLSLLLHVLLYIVRDDENKNDQSIRMNVLLYMYSLVRTCGLKAVNKNPESWINQLHSKRYSKLVIL